jgi:hypothetical protein
VRWALLPAILEVTSDLLLRTGTTAMSFALLERFRRDPVQVASGTPILSFDLEQHGDNSILKSKAPSNELFSVRGDSRITAVDLVESRNTLMMRLATKGVEAKITNEDWMPAYFLPWMRNAIVRTTLRPRSATTRVGGAKGLVPMASNPKFLIDQNTPGSGPLDSNDPDIFLTSAVNGCTVTIRGSREEPTVYHGNAVTVGDAGGHRSPVELAAFQGNQAGADNLITLKVQDMRRMLDAFELADPKANRLGGPHTAAGGKMLTQSSYQVLAAQGKVAPGQRAAVGQLAAGIAREEGVKPRKVRVVSSLGTVFGIRQEGRWTFYYQKLLKFDFIHDVAPWHKKAQWEKDDSHPATVRLVESGEFWPGGAGVLIP